MMKKRYDLSNLRVLIVDDIRFTQQILRNVLRALNITMVRCASDGADALAELETFEPDVIICDWEMEVLNGLELTKFVRTGPESRNPYVPILMLTAHTEVRRVKEARDFGVTEFLAKPISASDVYERLIRIIEKPRQFVKTKDYFGPDRRRTPPTKKTNKGRRKEDRLRQETDADLDETALDDIPNELPA